MEPHGIPCLQNKIITVTTWNPMENKIITVTTWNPMEFHVVTVIILFCKHWGSHSAFNFWICILWGPEDDSVGVETFSPCIYGYRYINKRLF